MTLKIRFLLKKLTKRFHLTVLYSFEQILSNLYLWTARGLGQNKLSVRLMDRSHPCKIYRGRDCINFDYSQIAVLQFIHKHFKLQ